jgi:hypothetical protein
VLPFFSLPVLPFSSFTACHPITRPSPSHLPHCPRRRRGKIEVTRNEQWYPS